MHSKESNSIYNPHEHAARLGIPVIVRQLPNPTWVACYSERHRTIFLRPHLSEIVERCAIAHELVHFERADEFSTPDLERIVDQISARRLIQPRAFYEVAKAYDSDSVDPYRLASELRVTVHIAQTYLELRQKQWSYAHLAL